MGNPQAWKKVTLTEKLPELEEGKAKVVLGTGEDSEEFVGQLKGGQFEGKNKARAGWADHGPLGLGHL